MPNGCVRGIGVLVALLLTLSACVPATPTLDIGDGGFLSGEPCGPPCFWGIVPGQTKEAEVLEILQKRGILEACEGFNKETEGGSRGIKCGSQLVIGFNKGSDLVAGVGFSPSDITVQEVIAKYGEPSGIYLGVIGVHMFHYQMIMAYPRILALVRLSVQDKWPYILEPSTPVTNIAYDVVFDENFSYNWEKWHGYGQYP